VFLKEAQRRNEASADAVAAACAHGEQVAPAAMRERPELLQRFQHRQLEQEVPIARQGEIGIGDSRFLSSRQEYMIRNIRAGAKP